MDAQTQSKTEAVGGEKKRAAMDELIDTINQQDDENDAGLLNEVKAIFKRKAEGTNTPAQKRVAGAQDELDAQRDAEDADKKRAYGTALRADPAELSDYRYRALPTWQREMRTPDNDYAVARYFRGLFLAHKGHGDGGDGGALLKQVMGEDKERRRHMRATLDIGATGGTDGVFAGEIGEALPLPVANYVNEILYRSSRFLALTRQFSGTESMRVPIQGTASTSLPIDEKETITANPGSVKLHRNLRLQKQAAAAVISNESLEAPGTAFSIVQWLTDDAGSELGEKQDALLWATGTGAAASEPSAMELNDVIVDETGHPGFFPLGAVQIADHTAITLIDAASVRALFYAQPEAERRNSIWAGPDQVMLAVSNIVDGNERQIYADANDPSKLVGDDLASGAIGTMHGRPVFNLPGAEAVLGAASDSNENRLYLINVPRSYATLVMGGVRVAVSPDASFLDDLTTFRFTHRYDGGAIGNRVTTRLNYRFIGGINGAGTPPAV